MKEKFHPTETYSKDTGLIIVLILLLAAYWSENQALILPGIAALIAAMTVPMIFKPVAVIWYHFSLMVGKMTNRIFLGLIFFGVVTPVSLVRKCLGFDAMQRKKWKNGTDTVFTEKNKTFTGKDLTAPF